MRCIELLSLGKGDTVLDVGCGTGLSFEPRGTHVLKGVPGKWILYRAIAY